MGFKENKKHVVFTNKAKCRDCNRCVRVCPVNAIKIENGQAQVISERCIDCGTCVVECPQHAKTYNNDLESILSWLQAEENVIASVAPSFASAYSDWEQLRLASALRCAGFSFIGETAVGAYHVAHQTRKHIENNADSSHICTSCPAVVSYVEKYAPDQIHNLVPVISPMHAHARILKQKNENCKVVFIGPCIAKIRESLRPEVAKDVDAAITFENLNELLKERGVLIENCDESNFDEFPGKDARVFPLEGGLLKTAGLDSGFMNGNLLSVSGPSEIKESIALLKANHQPLLIEPLYCKYGCINGPAIQKKKNNFVNRAEIIHYNDDTNIDSEVELLNSRILKARFTDDNPGTTEVFSEEAILEVLKKTGKENPENELNCGACGYDTCRLKAIAVLQGIAEPAMCIPYMRRLAEQRNNLFLNNDPNGVIILDDGLNIQNINPAFKKMFTCSDQVIGKPISYLLDPAPFENLATGNQKIFREEIKYPSYNLNCHLICYYPEEENQIVGIFVDITDFKKSKNNLKAIKTETVVQVHELLEHQENMAQNFAKFLGESTAQGEMLLQRLMDALDKQ